MTGKYHRSLNLLYSPGESPGAPLRNARTSGGTRDSEATPNTYSKLKCLQISITSLASSRQLGYRLAVKPVKSTVMVEISLPRVWRIS